MSEEEDRSWMNNRRNPNRRGITPAFIAGLEHFVQFAKAHPQYMHNGMIRCPCKRCKNKKFHRDGFVKKHLMDQGFVDGYKIWVAHGERYPVETSVQNRPTVVLNSAREPEQLVDEAETSLGMKDMVQNISDKAKTNRNSNEGQGSVHTGGSISLSESWDRLVKCHGPDVDASEAFLAMHSSVSPNGTRKWSSRHYQEIYETYVRRAREEATEEGIIEIESTGLPPFRAGLWKAITIHHGRQKGDRLPGFGNHGAAFFDLPLSSRSSQSFSSPSIQSVDYDAQMRQKDEIIASLTETLNTQVDTRVNTQVKKMEERMEERLRQEKERLRQEKEQMRQEMEQMRQEMKQKMQQQMQEMMRSMLQQQLQHQQQPPSGNNSNSSIGPYLNSNGTLSGSGRRGGRGGNNTQSRKSSI